MKTYPHTQHGSTPCPCDIDRVTEDQQLFLYRFDDWYGDKSYRCHEEVLEMIQPLVERLSNQRDVIKALQGQILERYNPGPVKIPRVKYPVDICTEDHPGQTCDVFDETSEGSD